MTEPRFDLPSYDVVIPCHDRACVVADAVASALAQSHPATRIVVVDDGSRDETPASLERLAAQHPSVVALLLPRNAGAAAARNAGIAACRSEFIAFLDSDDLWTADAAAALLGAAVEGGLDVPVGLFARVGLDGVAGPAECGWDGVDIRAALAAFGAVGTSWSMVRRSAVLEAGGWDPSFRTCEDWDFFVRVAARGARFGRVERLVAHYRTVAGERLIDDDEDLARGRGRVIGHPWLRGGSAESVTRMSRL